MRTNKKIILGTILILNAIASLAHAETQAQPYSADQYVNTLPVPTAIVPQTQPQGPRSNGPTLMQASFGM